MSYIFDRLVSVPDSILSPFIDKYGVPDWAYSFQARNHLTRITTVPFIKEDSITGVMKLWHSIEDTLRLGFMSKEDIDSTMVSSLSTTAYHRTRGHVISMLLSHYLKGQSVVTSYMDWLQSTAIRVTERSVYHCSLYCDVYISGVTGWAYYNQTTFDPVWYGVGGCESFSLECWLVSGGSDGGSSEIDDYLNNGAGSSGETGGGGDGGGGHANLNKLEQWLIDMGLSLDLYDKIVDCANIIPNPNGNGPDKVTRMDMPCIYSELLQVLLSISEEDAVCLSANQAVADEVIDWIVQEAVIDVCDPDRTTNEILAEAVSAACGSGGIDEMSDLYAAFSNEDYIIFSPRLKVRCPMYECVFREMVDGGPLHTKLICSILSGFEPVDAEHLLIAPIVFTAPNQNPDAYAGTTIVDGRVTILINQSKCNNITPIEVFETLQHELIHADIHRRLLRDYNWNEELGSISEAFLKMVELEYGTQATLSQHEFMLDYYLDIMAESLIAANNNIGSKEDFLGLLLNGFEEEVLDCKGLTLEDVAVLYGNYISFINQPGNLNSIFSGCN